MTFETNSSSTHSITICSQETYDKWCDGKVLFGDWNQDFIEAEELSAEDQKDYTTEYVLRNKKKKSYDEYLTRDEWLVRHNSGTETFSEYYTTKSGDKIVAFGYYGYD